MVQQRPGLLRLCRCVPASPESSLDCRSDSDGWPGTARIRASHGLRVTSSPSHSRRSFLQAGHPGQRLGPGQRLAADSDGQNRASGMGMSGHLGRLEPVDWVRVRARVKSLQLAQNRTVTRRRSSPSFSHTARVPPLPRPAATLFIPPIFSRLASPLSLRPPHIAFYSHTWPYS